MAKREDGPEVPALPVQPPEGELVNLPGPQGPGEPEEAPRKRKRKRKPAEAPPVPEGAASPEDLARCRDALHVTFTIASKIAAKKWGEPAAITDEEIDTLSDVWTSAIGPYLGQVGAIMPWATALVVTGLVVYPKYEAVQAAKATGPEIVE